MARIDDIPGISGASLDLLRAAGVGSASELLKVSSEELMGRLDAANGEGEIMPRLPAMASVEAWRTAAAVLEGREGQVRRPVALPTGEGRGAQPRALPTAHPMSAKQLREAGIPASSVPLGTLLPEEGKEEPPVENPAVPPAERSSAVAEVREPPADQEPKPRTPPREAEMRALVQRVDLGTGQVVERGLPRKSGDAVNFGSIGERQSAAQRVEKRNHGMLHRDPASVYLGAMATMLAMLLTIGGILAITAALVYFAFIQKETESEGMLRWLWLLVVFPVALVLYVTWGLRVRCRLCGQRLFLHKNCGKHVKAHRSPLGPVFAVALHAVTRGWFRCMLCGTKQRLRE